MMSAGIDEKDKYVRVSDQMMLQATAFIDPNSKRCELM